MPALFLPPARTLYIKIFVTVLLHGTCALTTYALQNVLLFSIVFTLLCVCVCVEYKDFNKHIAPMVVVVGAMKKNRQ